jgi:hypothetical protein
MPKIGINYGNYLKLYLTTRKPMGDITLNGIG